MPPIFAVKTTASHERTVADMIAERGEPDIHAVVAAEDMVAYVLVEAESVAPIERMLDEIPHAQKVLQQKTGISEIEHLFEETSAVDNVHEGDVVEVTDGPFSGQKAKIQRINHGDDKVTLKLLDASVPVPVTMRGDGIRVLESEHR